MEKAKFREKYIKRLCDKAGKEGRVEDWMRESYESAWDMYLEDETMTPEDMADEELESV